MSLFRTVLGDIAASEMGICYAHEHVAIRGKYIEDRFPEFLLTDLNRIARELYELRSFGVGTMIDAMPIDAGRSADDLVTLSKKTGMHIVAATGLHLRLYYPPNHWYDTIGESDLAEGMIAEIRDSMSDEGVRALARAGVIKVAGSRDKLTDLECRNFRAAGVAQGATGCPILTHTEQGTAALEQVQLLTESGADPAHIVLSHLDRNPDVGYQREVLSTGVKLEYDSAFRWKGERNHTLELLVKLAPEFPNSFVIGMDAAKSTYWTSFGGKPGLSFLVVDLVPMLLDAGLEMDLVENILVHTPALAYGFNTVKEETHSL